MDFYVDVIFDSNGDTPVIATQDFIHNGTKLTCLDGDNVGLNPDRSLSEC